jgi:hypothetical protein
MARQNALMIAAVANAPGLFILTSIHWSWALAIGLALAAGAAWRLVFGFRLAELTPGARLLLAHEPVRDTQQGPPSRLAA